MKSSGRIRQRLVAMLQRDIPAIGGKAIKWTPERLYRRQGRQVQFCDAYSWSGSPVWADTGNMAGLFDCWHPMAQCVRASRLYLDGNEVEILVGAKQVDKRK